MWRPAIGTKARLKLQMLAQPDDQTCGPTCLHALYQYYGDQVGLDRVVGEIERVEGGGTLGVILGCHALHRGYDVTIYTFNLQVFDPTWFDEDGLVREGLDLGAKLRAQMEAKPRARLHTTSLNFLRFLELGGVVKFEELTPGFLRRYLKRGVPLLTGLSSTYLYGCAREYGPNDDYDDVRGLPAGHFVILSGYDRRRRKVLVSDPMQDNPAFRTAQYVVSIERLIGAIMLGVLTYDANLLIVEPKADEPGRNGRASGGAGGKAARWRRS
jgi:hypothetical protein